jgi:hypothetical protein
MFDEFQDLTIYTDDFRSLGYCSKGVRLGFSKYELSYSDFIANGINAKVLLEAVDGNAMVLKVVEVANERRR